VYRTAPNGALAAVLSLMYPVSDVAIITMILVRLSRAPRRGRSVLLMLAAGLAIMAVADSSFAYLTAAGTYGTGNLLDTGWFGGYLIIGLAALRFVALPVRQAPPLTVTSRLQQLLPYPAVAAAFAVIIAQRVTSSTIDLFAFWSMLAIVLLVLVRQYLALGANVALVGTLAAREREMAYQAHHDALTDLPNRLAFRDAVTRALDNTRAGGRCAVMFIDLDDFKQINDRYGHASGDSVLRLVAERIKSNLRPEDVASRLGGDEFAVLVENAKSTTAVDTIARRILLTLRQPAAMDGRMLPVRGTIGIAISDRTVGGCDELLRRADVAMYAAKREGKDRCAVYTELAA
jgi:diguanylate cyclase (GGDEF)-like protein